MRRDDPADAEAISHKLLVRAGLIRQLSAGIYSILPLGWRVCRKIESLIRDEMDRIEVDAPTDAALKLLNDHREELAKMEAQFGVRISILPNAHLFSPHFHLRVYTEDKVETFSEGYTTDPTAPKLRSCGDR